MSRIMSKQGQTWVSGLIETKAAECVVGYFEVNGGGVFLSSSI